MFKKFNNELKAENVQLNSKIDLLQADYDKIKRKFQDIMLENYGIKQENDKWKQKIELIESIDPTGDITENVHSNNKFIRIVLDELDVLSCSEMSNIKLKDPVFVPNIGIIDKSELENVKQDDDSIHSNVHNKFYKVDFVNHVLDLYSSLLSQTKLSKPFVQDKVYNDLKNTIRQLTSQK